MILMNLNYNKRLQKRNSMKLEEELTKEEMLTINITMAKDLCKQIEKSFHFLNKKINNNKEEFTRFTSNKKVNLGKAVQHKKAENESSAYSMLQFSKMFEDSPKKVSKHPVSKASPKKTKVASLNPSTKELNTTLFILNRKSVINYSMRHQKTSSTSKDIYVKRKTMHPFITKSKTKKSQQLPNFRISKLKHKKSRSPERKRFLSLVAHPKSVAKDGAPKPRDSGKNTINLGLFRKNTSKENDRVSNLKSPDKKNVSKHNLKFSILGINSKLMDKIFSNIRFALTLRRSHKTQNFDKKASKSSELKVKRKKVLDITNKFDANYFKKAYRKLQVKKGRRFNSAAKNKSTVN